MEVAADGPGDGRGAAGPLKADHGALSRNVSSAKTPTSGHWLVGIYRMERVIPLANNQQGATHPDPHGPTMESASLLL